MSALSEDEITKRENIIINNIDIIYRIKNCFESINLLSVVTNQEKIRELCNEILTNLIPQLKGATAQLKRDYKFKAEEILSFVSSPKNSIGNHYKGLIMSIIGYLEDAHKAYRDNDFESCVVCLEQAEMLLPDTYSDIEKTLSNQIVNLRKLIN